MGSALDIRPYDPLAIAGLLNSQLSQAVKHNGEAVLAIPGGRSPGPVLTALAKTMDSKALESTALIWLDERWVPAGHPDRNDIPTLQAWERGGELPGMVLPMPAANLFPDPEEAATWYSHTLTDLLGPDPFLDAAFIGIGEDGHFASLFPDHPGLTAEGLVFVCHNSPKPPDTRLSLTLSLIRNTDLKVVLALGREKGSILRAALDKPGPHFPISLMFDDPSVVFFLDSEAMAAMGVS